MALAQLAHPELVLAAAVATAFVLASAMSARSLPDLALQLIRLFAVQPFLLAVILLVPLFVRLYVPVVYQRVLAPQIPVQAENAAPPLSAKPTMRQSTTQNNRMHVSLFPPSIGIPPVFLSTSNMIAKKRIF